MFGVVGLVLTGGFIEDALIQLREATIHSQLGHLQIYRSGYYVHGSQAPFKYAIDHPDLLSSEIRKLPHVVDVMERLNFSGLLNNGRADTPVLGEGLEPQKEARLGDKITVTAGRQLADKDHYAMLLGEGVASALRLKPGDHASLLVFTADGALNNLDFEVVGVFRSFSRDYDARAVRIPITASRELFNTNSANAIVVSLDKTAFTDEVASRLMQALDSRMYEVKKWEDLADFYDKTVSLYRRQFAVLQAIILLTVLLSVVNSVNMAIFERTGEFGTLKALGNTTTTIFRLVITENLLLALVGAGGGALLGMAFAYGISQFGIPMPPPPNANSGYVAFIQIVPWVVASAFLVGFAATVLAALAPARRVARLPVVDALRQNQ
jgi:putative ABC transport system permease protein